MLESLGDLHRDGELPEGRRVDDAERNVIKAIGKGLLKVMSKMGISTIQSYCGAQIFEAVGLDPALVERYFTGTTSRIGGVGVGVLAPRPWTATPARIPEPEGELLPVGGLYQWRREGERRMWDPETIALLQHSVRTNGDSDGARETYDRFAALVNEENARHGMLRGLLRFRDGLEPVPLEEVEPAAEIVKRFSTGGMSLGALSPEAHETLAIAMNRIGGQSNTGEGGEDERRYRPDANGDLRRSAIKQVASGRFGVTIDYLVNADQLQIKVAQGAKPGEGGQLPGHKVDRYIANLRHSTPGVGLISPPPHHDIYSIEDLKQLIYDLRCANPRARVSVKLVSEVGVGTVAAGVAKANADHVDDRRPRRGHRRLAAVLDPVGRRPVGDRAGRDPADAAGQRPALAHHRGGRRPDAHGPRRGDRRDARRRRVRLLDRPADRDRLHHDARLPPQHLPGGDRHAGPGAARALPRHPGARHQLPVPRGRGDARAHGGARRAHDRRADRPRRPARCPTRRSSTGRPRGRPLDDPAGARAPGGAPRRRTEPPPPCSTTPWTGS